MKIYTMKYFYPKPHALLEALVHHQALQGLQRLLFRHSPEQPPSCGCSYPRPPSPSRQQSVRRKKCPHGFPSPPVCIFHPHVFFNIEQLTATRKFLYFLPDNGPWKPSKPSLLCTLIHSLSPPLALVFPCSPLFVLPLWLPHLPLKKEE